MLELEQRIRRMHSNWSGEKVRWVAKQALGEVPRRTR